MYSRRRLEEKGRMNTSQRIRLSIAVLMVITALITIGALGPALASPDPRIVVVYVEDYRTGKPIGGAYVQLYNGTELVWSGFTNGTDEKYDGVTENITCIDDTIHTVRVSKGSYYAGTTAFNSASGVEVLKVTVYMSTTTGGFAVPVDKFGLLAPYIGVVSTIVVVGIAATSIYIKRRKEN